MIPDQLRPIVSRLLGVIVPVVLVKLFAWIGVPMPAELPSIVVDLSLVMLMYFLTHRLVDRKINPGDAASSTIAKVDLAKKEEIRSMLDPNVESPL